MSLPSIDEYRERQPQAIGGCPFAEDVAFLKRDSKRRAQVDVSLDRRLRSIEKKLGSLSWKLAVIVGAVEIAKKITELF